MIVAEGADFSPESLRTVRSIAATELRARGVAVIENESLEGIHPVGPATMDLAESAGADRVFVFRFGRLRKKVLMSLEEIQPPSETPVHVARLTASSLDESDTVIPRLVRSVLERAPVEAELDGRMVSLGGWRLGRGRREAVFRAQRGWSQ